MRTKTIWIISVLGLLSCCPTFAGSPTPSGNKIAVPLYDFAHIPPKTLAQAEGVATEIFATAGIDVYWTTEPVSIAHHLVSDFSSAGGAECAGPLASAIVPVQILPHAPGGFAPQALGYSLPCAELGLRVTVYANRLEMVSRDIPVMFYQVLGYALAHELGHVLLRSSTHEKTGLMKGVWSRRDWQRAAVANFPFTPDQAARMRAWLYRTENHEAASQARLISH